MRTTNPNLSFTYSSIGTSPHEFGLPVKTDSQPGNCTGLGPDIHLISRHFTSLHQYGGSLKHNPYDACSEGTHTKIHKFPAKPYPDSGIVGVLVKLEWYRIRTQPSVFFVKFTKSFTSHIHLQNLSIE